MPVLFIYPKTEGFFKLNADFAIRRQNNGWWPHVFLMAACCVADKHVVLDVFPPLSCVFPRCGCSLCAGKPQSQKDHLYNLE